MTMRPMLLAAVLLTGCAGAPTNTETPIDGGIDVARSVVLCQTTVAELELRLGRPSRDGLLGGSRLLTWIVEWDPLVKYLGVMANDAGTVVDLYWNLPSEVQWVPTDRCT